MTKYGSGSRKDVVNQCLEFGVPHLNMAESGGRCRKAMLGVCSRRWMSNIDTCLSGLPVSLFTFRGKLIESVRMMACGPSGTS